MTIVSLPDQSSRTREEYDEVYGSLGYLVFDFANREAELLAALTAIVRAHDHPADGTAQRRMRGAIVDARKLLGLASVTGVDGRDA